MSTRLVTTLSAAVLFFSCFPVAAPQAFAQYYTSTYTSGYGVLTVVSTFSNANNTYSYTYPGSYPFSISVFGNAPSPSQFQANLSSTAVTLGAGNYSVNPVPVDGWTITQSGNCQGAISNGQNLTCTLTYTSQNYAYNSQYPYNNIYPYNYPYNSQYTYNNTYPYTYGYPYNYTYPYNGSPLVCLPSYVRAGVGQTVTLTASGGVGTYNWGTSEHSYSNVGPTLNVAFQSSGRQLVNVTSGSQSATCTVEVTADGSGRITYPYSFGSSSYVMPSNYTTYSSNTPTLPNTGYEPQNGSVIAFALVLLLGMVLFLLPYARAAITSTRG